MAQCPYALALIDQNGQHHQDVPAKPSAEGKREEAEEAVEPAVMRQLVEGQEQLSIQCVQWLHAFKHGLTQVFSLLWMQISRQALLIGIKCRLGGLCQGCPFAAGAGGDLLGRLGNPIGSFLPRRGAYGSLFNSPA